MKPNSSKSKMAADQVVKDIRRKTRRHFSAEDNHQEPLRCRDFIASNCTENGKYPY